MVKLLLHKFVHLEDSKINAIQIIDRKLSELEVRAEILLRKAAIIKRDRK